MLVKLFLYSANLNTHLLKSENHTYASYLLLSEMFIAAFQTPHMSDISHHQTRK